MTDINQVWQDPSGFTAPVPGETTVSLEKLSDIKMIADLAIHVKSHLGIVAGSRHLGYIDKSQLLQAREKMNKVLRLAKKILAEG